MPQRILAEHLAQLNVTSLFYEKFKLLLMTYDMVLLSLHVFSTYRQVQWKFFAFCISILLLFTPSTLNWSSANDICEKIHKMCDLSISTVLWNAFEIFEHRNICYHFNNWRLTIMRTHLSRFQILNITHMIMFINV